jgi:hypothetical protein
MFYAAIEADVNAGAMAPVMSALAGRTEYLRVLARMVRVEKSTEGGYVNNSVSGPPP